MKVAMYLRKSRAEELSKEETLKRHRETLTEFAEQNGLAVADVYEEVASGESLSARPEMLKLLEAVGRGAYDAVLCMDIDRLGRGAMSDQGRILEVLKSSGTRIITPRKLYDLSDELDETYSEFESFLARQELKAIKRRMQRGIRRTIEDGGYVANPPYGYERAYRGKRPTLAVKEDEAGLVRLIFSLYTERGFGCQRIADTLNAMGAKPRRAEQFGRTSVMKILRNPVYAGKIVWNRKMRARRGTGEARTIKTVPAPRENWIIADGIHPPIIPESLFGRTQERIGRKIRPPANAGPLENPLAGLVFCKNCGAPMQRRPLRDGEAYLICQKRGCMTASPLHAVEDAVLKAVKEQLGPLELQISALPEKGAESGRENLEAGRQNLLRQMERLHDLLEQGVYTPEIFLARRELLRKKLEKLESAGRNSPGGPESHEAEKPFPQSLEELYAAMDAHGKNLLLKSLIEKIVYSKEKGAKPNEFRLEIFFPPFF